MVAPKKSAHVRPKITGPIFPACAAIELSDDTVKKVAVILLDWTSVIGYLGTTKVSSDKVRKLIVAEAQTRNRPTMLQRLVSRLHILELNELKQTLKLA